MLAYGETRDFPDRATVSAPDSTLALTHRAFEPTLFVNFILIIVT